MKTIGKMRGMFVGLIAILFVGATDAFGGPEQQQRDAVRDVAPVVGASGQEDHAGGDQWTIRSHAIGLDVGMLNETALQVQQDGAFRRITIPLFDDLTVPLEVRDVSVSDSGFVNLSGAIPRSIGSDFTITVSDTRVAGFISMPSVGQFTIRPIGGGMHEVRQIDMNAMPTCGVGPEHEGNILLRPRGEIDAERDMPEAGLVVEPGDVLCNQEVVVRLVVFVTPAALEAVEDPEDLLVLLDTDIAFTNKSLSLSKANVLFKVVAVYLVDHDEEGSPPDDLEELRFGAIEVEIAGNPTVHDVRAFHCADFVTMIVSYTDDPVCGVAYIMPSPSELNFDTAFNVVRVECMGGRTLAHELGHNMGCAHDHFAGGAGTYFYSHGHRYEGPSVLLTPDDDTLYGTIMTYPPFAVPVPRFSNPEVDFPDGYPTGVPINQPLPAHNALTITNNSPFFSQYGQMVGGSFCTEPSAIEVPQDHPTIQAAIDAASNGVRIRVFPGVYNERIDFKGKAIEMVSIDPCNPTVVEATIINGIPGGSTVTFKSGEGSNTILNGFTIRNGVAPQGGGVLIQNSSPKLQNLIITDNHATLAGGGISSINGSPELDRVFFVNNTAGFRGAGMYVRGGSDQARIERTYFYDNHANILAGGLFLENSNATVFKTTFDANTAGSLGGAMYVIGGSPTIELSSILDNHVTAAESKGGGIYVRDSTLTITESEINENTAGMSGGGVFVFVDEEDEEEDWILPAIGSTQICDNMPNNIFGPWNNLGNNEICSSDQDHIVCENPADPGDCVGCTFSSIQTAIEFANEGDSILVCEGEYFEQIDFDGKPIYIRSENPSDPAVVAATIINGQGGGVVLKFVNNEGSDTRVNGFTVKGGQASNGGGALIQNSSPLIENCIFENNNALSSGGGVAVFSSSGTIVGSTFRNNSAGNSGGGFYIQTSDFFTFENCTLENNHASSTGGGIAVFASNNMMSEIVLDGNTATNLGGGMRVAQSSQPFIQGFTVMNNSAVAGGGISSSANSEALVAASLFCENTPTDIDGPWVDFGGNNFDNVCPVANSSLFNPTPLSGSSGSINGSFAGATNFGTSSCEPDGIDVFYLYEVTDGPVTLMLDTCGSSSNTALAVFDSYYNEIGCSTTCGGSPCGDPHACLYLAGLENGSYIIRVSLVTSSATSSGPEQFTLNYGSTDYVPGDLNGDNVVDGIDLLILLSNWGDCPPLGDCPADLNNDGSVDGLDLLIMLSNWG